MTSTTTTALKAALAIGCAFTLTAGHAAGLGKDEAKAREDRIEATYKADKEACDRMSDNAKDICMAEAKGKQKVAKAELDYAKSGNDSDRSKVTNARANAEYDVAKERCDDKSGNQKDVCLKEAKAAEERAKADAKATKKVSEARRDATDEKRDSAYEAARERCDAMSGDAKQSCIDAAKARHGKS